MASAPPNPTQLTPPRVAVIDERTGAISREWYRFFLSLLTSTQNTSDAADTQPDANALMATYDAMLATMTQETQTNTSDLSSSLQQQINDVFNATAITPPSSGGTVTSVDASGGSTGLVFTGGPITTSGTLTLSGTLDVDNGGTGQTSYTDGQLLIGNTTGNTLAKSTLTAGTAISITNGAGSITITNTAPDQTVSLTAGTGISISGTYPSFTITNTLPDQIVSLTGAGTTVVTGTYPNFTITSNDQYVGTVTSVSGTGTVNGITLTGTVTSSGSLTLGGTLGGIANSQLTNSSITINGSAISLGGSVSVGTVTSVSGTGTVNGITLTGTVTSSGSLTLGGTLSGVSLTTQVSGTLPVGNGGTGTATAFTAGSVVFAGASGVYSQDNANFFWDDTNNSLGVGTNSLNARLSLGSLVSNKVFALYDDGTNQYGMGIASSQYRMFAATGASICFGNYARGTDTFTETMRLDGNGKLLIGTTSVTAASVTGLLQVESEIISKGSLAGFFFENRSGGVTAGSNWFGWYNSGGTTYFYNPAVGNIASINSATGAYTALSDAAKKKDFEPSAVGLDAVLALKPTLFRMDTDADDAPKQLGFVAQEVKDHIPQAYVEEQNTDAGGNESTYIGLNDRPIIAALVKAVQELEARVAQLEG
jgi:hypothetical protein